MEVAIALGAGALLFLGAAIGAWAIARAPDDSALGHYREHVSSYGFSGFLLAGVLGGMFFGIGVAFIVGIAVTLIG